MKARINVGRDTVWASEDCTPAQIDAELDRIRAQERYGVSIDVQMSRSERRKIRDAVRKRDGRRCRKCGSKVDVKIVSMFRKERHNPDRMVMLCRPCRHARVIAADADVSIEGYWEWVLNGKSGLEERAENYLTRLSSTPEFEMVEKTPEEHLEFIKFYILCADFGLDPAIDRYKRGLSPLAQQAMREYFHGIEPDVPDSLSEMLSGLDTSKLPSNRSAIYHLIDFDEGITMRVALGELDTLVAAAETKDTPIYFDIVNAPNQEQYEAAVMQLREHCQRQGYVLVDTFNLVEQEE